MFLGQGLLFYLCLLQNYLDRVTEFLTLHNYLQASII